MLISPVDSSIFRVAVAELDSHSFPSCNHHVYLRLRLALSLNLQRQIFIAVCDDPLLRDHLAAELQADLNTQPGLDAACQRLINSTAPQSSPLHAPLSTGEGKVQEPSVQRMSGPAAPSELRSALIGAPKLITLALDLHNPDVFGQMERWYAQDAAAEQASTQSDRLAGFQITGIETLTRQPAHVQQAFLNSLQSIAEPHTRNVAAGTNLILWVTRPWCRSIQQSAPDFWQFHTAVFEFEGDFLPPDHQHTERSQPERAMRAVQPTRSPKAAPKESLIDPELRQLVIATLQHEVEHHPELLAASATDLETQPRLQPASLLHKLEKAHRDRDTMTLSTLYRDLGDWYRDDSNATTNPTYLAIAIRAYEQAIRFIDTKAPQVTEILNDIGNLYWMMARGSSEPLIYLKKALKAYQFAIDRTDPDNQTATYAMVLNNLGSLHSDLAQHENPVEELQAAIAAYRSCLHHRSAAVDPARYAATQNNLGTAFWNLAQHQQAADNLQYGISAYNEALRCYDPELEPLYYAMVQNNIGTAYWQLAQCEDAMDDLGAIAEDFLLLAIGAYRVALMYRTFEEVPASYAATQNNLGTAYWHLSNLPTMHYDDRHSYLKCAIEAYEAAIGATQFTGVNFDISATHHNLGSALHTLAVDNRSDLDSAARSTYFETALTHHVQAYNVWQQRNPDLSQNALSGIIQTVKTMCDRGGIQGQTLALSRVPAQLLPTIMKQL